MFDLLPMQNKNERKKEGADGARLKSRYSDPIGFRPGSGVSIQDLASGVGWEWGALGRQLIGMGEAAIC